MRDTERIRLLNDLLRKTLLGGKVMLTRAVNALDAEHQSVLIRKIQAFRDFNEDNDPHQEHDFGSVEVDGKTYFFKIEYYDRTMDYASPDPSCSTLTTRVLTIMEQADY